MDFFDGIPYKNPCLNAEGEEGRESRGSKRTLTTSTIIATLTKRVKLNVVHMPKIVLDWKGATLI